MHPGWIAFTILLMDSCAIGMVVPAFPVLFETFSSDAEAVTRYFTYSISLFGFVQLFGAPLLGSLSDRFGRKSIAVVSLLGAAGGYALMAFSYFLPLVFVGRVFSALAGANLAVIAAYLADASTPKNRSANFGLMGAGFGMGFIVGPFLGGQLSNLGPRASFLVAALLMVLNTLVALFLMQETLQSHLRKTPDKEAFQFLSRFLKLPQAVPFLACYFLIFLADQVYTSNWIPYTRYQFQWTGAEIGTSLSFAGICIAIGQGLVTRWMVAWFGEVKTILFGLVAYCVGFWGVMAAQQSSYLYVALISFTCAVVAGPALQALISHRVPGHEQGKLQGILLSLVSLSTMVGPFLYNGLFLHFTGQEAGLLLPGVAYLVASFFCVICIVILWRCSPSSTVGN